MVQVYTGGRRTAATGAIFKRELKSNDNIQGSGLIDAAVSPGLPDVFDGQILFYPKFEKSVAGNNLADGEISIGDSYASVNYLIEAPVKRPPTFGAGDLVGIDLNISHDNLNFNESEVLPDIEVYKFKRSLSDLTVGTFGVPETEDLIVGSSRYSRTPLLSESFSSEYTTKSGGFATELTGEIILEPETAYKLAKNDIDVYDGGYVGCSADSLTEFRDRYCTTLAGGRQVCKLVQNWSKHLGGEYEYVPSKGVKWWRNDPMYFRPSIDRVFCIKHLGQDWWDNNKVIDAVEYLTAPTEKTFTMDSDVTTKNSIFDKVVTFGDFYSGTREDDGSPIYQNFAKAHFTKDSESGNGMAMSLFFDASNDSMPSEQMVMCTLRLPKPLEIAREHGEPDEMNSLEVDVRFSIKSMAKQHISNIADGTKYGFNMFRSFGMICATRPPKGASESIGNYIKNMNQTGVTDLKNAIADETENSYNGFVIMRHFTGTESNDPYEGDLKINWSGLKASKSKGWGGIAATGNAKLDIPYVVKTGADDDSTPSDGTAVDPDYLDTLADDTDIDKPVMDINSFYTCKILINNKASSGAGDVTWMILNDDNDIIATRTIRHVGGSPSDSTNVESGFPQYLTLFAMNCDVGGADEILGSNAGAIYNTNAVNSDVEVIIDSIKIGGFAPVVQNMTTGPISKVRQAGSISGSLINAIDTDGTFTVGDNPPIFSSNNVVPTYLSYGTKTDVLSNNLVNVFMGSFTSSNPKFNDKTDNTKTMNVRDSGAGTLGADNTNSDIILRIPEGSSHPKLGSWPCSAGDTNLNAKPNRNDALLMEGTNYVDDLTKKGFFTIDFTSATDPDARYISRENPLFSTKVLKIISDNEIEVLNPNVLQGFDDDEFIIYRAGYDYSTGKVKTVKLRNGRSVGKTLKFETSIVVPDSGSGKIGTNTYLNELYISPKRFWFILEIYHKDATNDDILPDKTYGYALLQKDTAPGSVTRGLTYNESLYTDTAGSSNKWKMTMSHVGGLIEDGIDYGYGAWESENNTSDDESGVGYIAKYVPQSGFMSISLDGLVDVEKSRLSKPDEKVSLYLQPSQETRGVCAIRTTKYGGASDDPFFTFYYVDGLPTIEDFKITPNKDNPMFPDFEWSSPDDDLWYGFLLFSNTEIKHQYHDAVAVLHLNETDVSAASNFKLKRYDGVYNGTEVSGEEIGSGTKTSAEGLAGNALITDAGEDSFVTWAAGGYTQPTNQFSVVAHFTCDSIAHTGFIVGKFGEFDLSVDTSGNINAAITPNGGTEVTLKSTSVINTDGETPTNVILTFDVGLPTANVKLFINGKLEDQTGLKTTAGSANNWKAGANLAADANSELTVGIEPVDAGGTPNANGFSGKIEEIVLYNKAIYPVIPKTGKFTFTKPIEELSVAPIATGISNVARLFIKDYHNIRGTSSTEVASSSNVAYKKAGLGLKTD